MRILLFLLAGLLLAGGPVFAGNETFREDGPDMAIESKVSLGVWLRHDQGGRKYLAQKITGGEWDKILKLLELDIWNEAHDFEDKSWGCLGVISDDSGKVLGFRIEIYTKGVRRLLLSIMTRRYQEGLMVSDKPLFFSSDITAPPTKVIAISPIPGYKLPKR